MASTNTSAGLYDRRNQRQRATYHIRANELASHRRDDGRTLSRRGYYPHETEEMRRDATPGRRGIGLDRKMISVTPMKRPNRDVLPPGNTAPRDLAGSAPKRRMPRDHRHGVRGGTCLVAVWGWRRGRPLRWSWDGEGDGNLGGGGRGRGMVWHAVSTSEVHDGEWQDGMGANRVRRSPRAQGWRRRHIVMCAFSIVGRCACAGRYGARLIILANFCSALRPWAAQDAVVMRLGLSPLHPQGAKKKSFTYRARTAVAPNYARLCR